MHRWVWEFYYFICYQKLKTHKFGLVMWFTRGTWSIIDLKDVNMNSNTNIKNIIFNVANLLYNLFDIPKVDQHEIVYILWNQTLNRIGTNSCYIHSSSKILIYEWTDILNGVSIKLADIMLHIQIKLR